MKNSAKADFRMQILQHYFTFSNDVATLELVYDTFSELINPNFGDSKIEKLNEKLFSDVLEAVSLLPRKYKLDLHLVIKDFGEYSVEECEEIIRQNLRLKIYHTLCENNRKLVSGWSLIGAGAVILAISYLLHRYELWFDLINISGTLFVWEGVNTAFLERKIENRAKRKLAKSIRNIAIEKSGEVT